MFPGAALRLLTVPASEAALQALRFVWDNHSLAEMLFSQSEPSIKHRCARRKQFCYRAQSGAEQWLYRLHGRVGVAQRTGLNVHVVLNNGLGVAKRHDGHGIGDRGRDSVVEIIKASVVSQASGVATLPLCLVLASVYLLWLIYTGEEIKLTLAQARSTFAWWRKKRGSLGDVAGPMSPKMML